MKLTCYIFTHTPEAPLLAQCVSTARAGLGDHEATFIVVEDGNAPLAEDTRTALIEDDVSVVRSVSPRRGNLRGRQWFAEQMEIMSDHAGEADVVVKIDPDTQVLSISNVVKPLVENPLLSGCGYGSNKNYVYGPCYAFRRWIIDATAAKYAVPFFAGQVEHEELLAATGVANRMGLGTPIHEDVLLGFEANAFGPLDTKLKRYNWHHQNDARDLAALKSGADVVLFGNPKPVSHLGVDTTLVISRTIEAFLAADTILSPLPEREKPLIVLGLGPGRSGTAFLATLLNMQPGCHVTHESYSPLPLGGVLIEGFAQRLAVRSAGRRFVGDVSLIHVWMAERMTRWLVDHGYQVRLVVTQRDEEALVASWVNMMESQKHDPFLTIPPEGWPHRGWSKALPKFDDIPDRSDRVRAYLAWCADRVAALQTEFPGMVRTIDIADMNDSEEVHDLFDWIGISAAGRRLELLGTPVNATP